MTEPSGETALVPVRPRPKAPAIRPERMPRPIEKAAMILTAIGPELGTSFLEGLNEQDIERFALAVSQMGKVNQDVLDAVIVEFLDLLTDGPEVAGGARAARKLLAGMVEEDELERMLGREAGTEERSVWQRLDETPAPALATFISAEHPQTAAVILTELRAEIAANALERLDPEFAKAVVLRLSRVPTLDAAVAQAIERTIERDFISVLQRNLSKRRPADLIAGLMNNISTEVRDGFLNFLESQEPSLAQDVQRTMFTFEDISVRLHGRDVAGVLRDVPEEDLLKALKLGEAQKNATVAFILKNLPRRLSDRYVEELAALEDVSRKEGEAAQIEITKVIQAQAKVGQIRLIEREPE